MRELPGEKDVGSALCIEDDAHAPRGPNAAMRHEPRPDSIQRGIGLAHGFGHHAHTESCAPHLPLDEVVRAARLQAHP